MYAELLWIKELFLSWNILAIFTSRSPKEDWFLLIKINVTGVEVFSSKSRVWYGFVPLSRRMFWGWNAAYGGGGGGGGGGASGVFTVGGRNNCNETLKLTRVFSLLRPSTQSSQSVLSAITHQQSTWSPRVSLFSSASTSDIPLKYPLVETPTCILSLWIPSTSLTGSALATQCKWRSLKTPSPHLRLYNSIGTRTQRSLPSTPTMLMFASWQPWPLRLASPGSTNTSPATTVRIFPMSIPTLSLLIVFSFPSFGPDQQIRRGLRWELSGLLWGDIRRQGLCSDHRDGEGRVQGPPALRHRGRVLLRLQQIQQIPQAILIATDEPYLGRNVCWD